MKKHGRAKKYERAVRLVWDSLQSHLPYLYEKSPEGASFHKKTIAEYAELLRLLADLY